MPTATHGALALTTLTPRKPHRKTLFMPVALVFNSNMTSRKTLGGSIANGKRVAGVCDTTASATASLPVAVAPRARWTRLCGLSAKNVRGCELIGDRSLLGLRFWSLQRSQNRQVCHINVPTSGESPGIWSPRCLASIVTSSGVRSIDCKQACSPGGSDFSPILTCRLVVGTFRAVSQVASTRWCFKSNLGEGIQLVDDSL